MSAQAIKLGRWFIVMYLLKRIEEHQAYISKVHQATPTTIQTIGWIEGELGWRRRAIGTLRQALEMCTDKVCERLYAEHFQAEGGSDA